MMAGEQVKKWRGGNFRNFKVPQEKGHPSTIMANYEFL
jgi:hypothetical protein